MTAIEIIREVRNLKSSIYWLEYNLSKPLSWWLSRDKRWDLTFGDRLVPKIRAEMRLERCKKRLALIEPELGSTVMAEFMRKAMIRHPIRMIPLDIMMGRI